METIPVVVTYNTVQGGVIFHVPPRASPDNDRVASGGEAKVNVMRSSRGAGNSRCRAMGFHDDDGEDDWDDGGYEGDLDVEVGREDAEGYEFGIDDDDEEYESEHFLSDYHHIEKLGSREEAVYCSDDGEDDGHGDDDEYPEELLEGQEPSSKEAMSGETSDGEQEQQGVGVRLRLENAFPGRSVVATVSLRTNSQRGGTVHGIVSSGPLVRTELMRRDLPGIGYDLVKDIGDGQHGAPVEVRAVYPVRFLCLVVLLVPAVTC